MKKKIIIVSILWIIGAILAYNYVYKDHRNITEENAEFAFTSKEISNEFLIAPSDSEKKYLDKTIEVSGTISEGNNHHIVINEKIFCQLQDSLNKPITIGNPVKLKGRCIGYDNLLEEIKFDQCTIINP